MIESGYKDDSKVDFRTIAVGTTTMRATKIK